MLLLAVTWGDDGCVFDVAGAVVVAIVVVGIVVVVVLVAFVLVVVVLVLIFRNCCMLRIISGILT